ncbi:helix-turn-helix domain-containing protein [Flavobacterium sp. '19STA2R22 D10 B1']|uniref:helix-turn-helix domain-containing protein n=1 Tax=Flavobacterium aerium TaxID=3037261 RepID=UPI00278C7AD1|nr:AraC family transcriptional regulator [Flavobacterium sp. '19STA2R22 D10 B1']
MNLYVKYDIHLACKMILKEQLDLLGVSYEIKDLNALEISDSLSDEQLEQLNEGLNRYGIEIVNNQKTMLIQKIKDTITEMVYSDEKQPQVTMSVYLAEQLNHSYGYLSNLFSEITYTSIENFIIIQKIERVKQLIIAQELTLTEISYLLNYSSVAHLSNQFKKTTGLTPTSFQRIITRRRAVQQEL